jgi:predicted short-subunit dehydrogenase-like oxidoreductase (DUF2520 family)
VAGADSHSLAGITFCLVGPGRVGESLAAWAVARGARLDAVAGRSPAPAAALAARLGGRAVAVEALASGGRDLLLVAVPDGAIAGLAGELAARPQATVALHTAGSLGASVLAPLRTAGSAVGCFHPLKAFPHALPDPAEGAGTFFALDGPAEALALGERLAVAFGGVSGVVPEGARDLYHLAASVAAGGVATLVASAGDLARSLGLPDAVLRGYLELARGALRALGRELSAGARPERAITGPLARGDAATFLRELEALRAAGPPASRRVPLLCRLALETVRLTAGEASAADLAKALRARGFLDRPGDRC